MPLLCLSYILINVFDDLSLSYLQRHIVRNHQMSRLRTPEMIHFPFVLILFLNKHWVLNVKPECKTDHVSVCAVSIDTQRPQCDEKKKKSTSRYAEGNNCNFSFLRACISLVVIKCSTH